MDIAKVIRQALAFWGNPSMAELPPETVVEAVNRAFQRHAVDLDLAPDAAFYSATSSPVTLTATEREKLLDGITDLSRVIAVESRPVASANADHWERQTIRSFDHWDTAELAIGGYAVALRRTVAGLVLVVPENVSAISFRIVYRALRPRIAETDATANLPDAYEGLMVYDLALELGEIIDDRSPEFRARKTDKMRYLLGRVSEESDRAERWRRAQNGGGPKRRRAFNDRGLHGPLAPRRFTVRY